MAVTGEFRWFNTQGYAEEIESSFLNPLIDPVKQFLKCPRVFEIIPTPRKEGLVQQGCVAVGNDMQIRRYKSGMKIP